MKLQEYVERVNKEKAFLDSIDLKPILEEYGPFVEDVMEAIEFQYGYMYQEEPFVFNCLSKASFRNYLTKRYGWR